MSLNPLEQLNLITMAAIAAIFLASFLILRKIIFLPLIDVMEKRARKLERAQAKYDEAGALVAKARGEAEKIMAGAAEESDRLSKQVTDEISRMREPKIAEANAEADTVLARGREEVSRLKESEQAKLKEHLLACSRQTLVKMIGEVNEHTLRFVVARVLAARGAEKEV
jgi:F-type H+-transporting ATPase subunit b